MNILLISLLVLLGVVTRVVPHPPNFTPILSIALLSGLYFKNRFSIIIPISIMLFSDIFIGSHLTTPWVYSSILIIYLFGQAALKNNSFKNVIIASIGSSLVFFLLTNFGVWVVGYPHTISGFTACFVAAIPFYKNTLFSVLLYSTLIHGGYLYLIRQYSYQKTK